MALQLRRFLLNTVSLRGRLWQLSATSRHLSQVGSGDPVHPDELQEVSIPTPKVREGESADTKMARLIYQSRKRGMLENGLLLSNFASSHLSKLNASQLDLYDNLINIPSNDWDIFHWITCKNPTPEEYDNEVMDMLKEYCKNKEGESRITQPSLY